MTMLCVIPARGGSKRIPRKNIRDFCGKPIIAWSIEAALATRLFDDVVVSTDDEEIAGVARAFGASTPFIRPAPLADDHTPTVPVIAHAIAQAMPALPGPALVCCIYPTAPFVTPEVLRSAALKLEQHECDYAAPVTRFSYPIDRALRLDGAGFLHMRNPEYALTRSQDLEEAWHDAGQFYWGRAAAWLAHRPVFTSPTLAIPLPLSEVQDIDTAEDWEVAEHLFRARQDREDSAR